MNGPSLELIEFLVTVAFFVPLLVVPVLAILPTTTKAWAKLCNDGPGLEVAREATGHLMFYVPAFTGFTIEFFGGKKDSPQAHLTVALVSILFVPAVAYLARHFAELRPLAEAKAEAEAKGRIMAAVEAEALIKAVEKERP